MTYFSGADQNSNTQEAQTQDFLAQLVQEKGEQWKDPATLAKGYVASQEFIKQLQQEKEALLADLKKQDYAKSVLDELKTIKQPTVGTLTNSPQKEENTTQTPDIRAMIKETLTQQEQERLARQNLATVDQKLAEVFGANAPQVVEAKRLELGLSKDRLKEIASESPQAFLRLIGEAPAKDANTTPKSSVNSIGLPANSPSVRNQKYYTDLRRTNPSVYHSGKIQNQMLQDRLALGDKFYQ